MELTWMYYTTPPIIVLLFSSVFFYQAWRKERGKRLTELQLHREKEKALLLEIEVQKHQIKHHSKLAVAQRNRLKRERKRKHYIVQIVSIVAGLIWSVLSEEVPLGVGALVGGSLGFIVDACRFD